MATAKTYGIWTQVNGQNNANVPLLNGLNTKKIQWGQPANDAGYAIQGPQSGYQFEGVNNVNVPLDGTEFLLGTFTHFNFVIQPGSISSANLLVTIEIEGGLKKEFNFLFNHNETPNPGVNGACPQTPGYSPPCPDIVSIPNLQSTEKIMIDGKEYVVTITGFLQNNKKVNQFITLEKQENHADIYAKLEPVAPIVKPPEKKVCPCECVYICGYMMIPQYILCPYPINVPQPVCPPPQPVYPPPPPITPPPQIIQPPITRPPQIIQPPITLPPTYPAGLVSTWNLSIICSGTWINVTEQVPGGCNLIGIGTNQISWGIPYGGVYQSAYRFNSFSTITAVLGGSYFYIGTFTHYNFPVLYSITAVTLSLNLIINGTQAGFSFALTHQETPNQGPTGTPDIVTFINSRSREIITLNNKQYALQLGFYQNGQIVERLSTIENQVNTVYVAALFVEVQSSTQFVVGAPPIVAG